jgi:hypothetical protein
MTLGVQQIKNLRRFALVLCSASLLLGCAALIPTIRDDYMGKSLLQPHKVPQRVEFDERGNPITEKPWWYLWYHFENQFASDQPD